MYITAVYRQYSLLKNLYNFLKWGLGRSPKRGEGGSPTLSPGMDAGRVCPNALCKDAYKWSNKVGAGRTDNKRPRLHRCKANQAYTAFHGGKGFGDRDCEQAPFLKTDFFYKLNRRLQR